MDLDYGKKIIKLESEAINGLLSLLDDNFTEACRMIYECKGRVVVTGMGKAGIIGQKISASLSSTGSPSFFLHPAEAIHGDLGRIIADDVIIALSKSGETEEINKLIKPIKTIGAKLICITGNPQSSLAKICDVVLNIGDVKEACPLGLAPTTSTTTMLVLGDALTIAVLNKRDFGPENFALFHPGGSLGRKLLKVEEVMRDQTRIPFVREDTTIKEVILAITTHKAGAACVVKEDGYLCGIFTDGDLRRKLQESINILSEKVSSHMTKAPLTVKMGDLASEALEKLKNFRIDEIPVIDEDNKLVGMIDVQDLLEVGFS